MSVYTYTEYVTNLFGGVLSEDIKYGFMYVGDDGQPHEFKGFVNTKAGLYKIYLGDSNKYVTEQKGWDTYRYLYVTKETFNTLDIR